MKKLFWWIKRQRIVKPKKMLVLLFTVSLVCIVAPPTMLVRAQTIYIDSNYTFENDLSENIEVIVNNIVIDGNGHTLHGANLHLVAGIYLSGRSNVTIKNLTITGWDHGIRLTDSSHINITSNTLINNRNYGITLSGSSHNSITGNTITNNEINCIRLSSSSINIITGNTITNSRTHGIRLMDSPHNVIYHNNFIDNIVQAYDDSPENNDWHHPELLEGNYWDNYPGMDDGSGTGKHAIVGDGIGDSFIPWPSSNFDLYPFVQEYGWIHKLNIKLAGEFDYTEDELIHAQIAALVTDQSTQLPASEAIVTIAIYDPVGELAFGTPSPMMRNADTPGVYLWQSPTTLADSDLPNGIYLVYVTASFDNGPQTVAMQEFHIQAPAPCDCTCDCICPEPTPTPASLFPDVLRILPVAVLAGALILLRRRRKHRPMT